MPTDAVERQVADTLAYLRRRLTGDYVVDEFGFDEDYTLIRGRHDRAGHPQNLSDSAHRLHEVPGRVNETDQQEVANGMAL